MTCCLNPKCQRPHNSEDIEFCQACGTRLVPLLRGRYQPVRLIGQGGFGRTYLALDADRLSTRCVIKQFAPQTQGTKSMEKAIRLFNQEAIRLHELGEHPQIPTLLAYFEQDEYLYLIQQFVEGPTLALEAKQQGGFDETKVRAVLNDLLALLQFIHQHQVVHRDLTPSNVIRRRIDGRLVLIDFGVAKQLNAVSGSQTGTKIGTEGYSPIEQLRSGKVYPASDLYSLGATCLYLMTLTRPDDLYDPLSGRWLWRERLRSQGKTISPQLGHILDKMVEDLVSRRYQTTEEVLRDLQTPPTSTGSMGSTGSSSPLPTTSLGPTTTSSQTLSRPPVSTPPAQANSAGRLSGPGRASRPPASGSRRGPGWHCVRTLGGHSSWVMDVVISPNSPTVISGGLDDTIRVWNARTGEQLSMLTGHARGVNALAVSPDGQVLASCSDDDTVKVWDLYSSKLIYTLKDHTRDVTSLAISANGRILASGSEDKTIRLWNLRRGTPLQTITGSAGMIKAIALGCRDQILASGGLDNKVRLWNIETGEHLRSLSGHFNSVNTVLISPDGKTVVSGSKDKTIRLWNLQTGELLQTLSNHTREVNALAISADGKTLVSGGNDATVRVWNLQTGQLLHTLSDHLNAVKAIAVSASGNAIVSGSFDKTIKIWQLFP